MIVFLYGPDSYRRLTRKRFYRDQFEKKYSKRARTLDLAEEGAIDRLAEVALAASLFAGKELFILENLSEVTDESVAEGRAQAKKILPLLVAFAEDKNKSVLISEDTKPAKALGILLKKPVISEDFPHLGEVAWAAFVKKEAETRGVELDAGALRLLLAVYSKNSWGLATELDKLSTLEKPATRATLAAFGLEEPEGQYWALINGLRSSRGSARLGALERLFLMGEPPPKIFNIIGPMWTERLADFARYDIAIKSGKMGYEEALADAVLM